LRGILKVTKGWTKFWQAVSEPMGLILTPAFKTTAAWSAKLGTAKMVQ
jgi:hypothetical protein